MRSTSQISMVSSSFIILLALISALTCHGYIGTACEETCAHGFCLYQRCSGVDCRGGNCYFRESKGCACSGMIHYLFLVDCYELFLQEASVLSSLPRLLLVTVAGKSSLNCYYSFGGCKHHALDAASSLPWTLSAEGTAEATTVCWTGRRIPLWNTSSRSRI